MVELENVVNVRGRGIENTIEYHKTEGCVICTSRFNDDTSTMDCEGLDRLEESQSAIFRKLTKALSANQSDKGDAHD